MAASKKRSLSDMQQSDRGSKKQNDDDTYRMMVLRLDETEDEFDQNLLQTALDLGIDVPQGPKTRLDLVISNVSNLNISPPPSDLIILPPSRASQSTHTASDSSLEHQRHRQTPSLSTTSITSVPSISSTSSNKSSYVKVKKSFRRISRLHRRKTMTVPVPALPLAAASSAILPAMLQVVRPGLHHRSITADQIETAPNPQPHAMTTNQIHTLSLPNNQVLSVTYNAPPPCPPTLPPPPPPEAVTPETIAARRRSISDPTLKKLRTTQLQEQLRFISFEASQHRLMRTKQLQHKRDALSQYHRQQKEIHVRHAEALTSLEQRHLSAEVDLHRTLQLERQACDTRLKHMQAYCNPRSTVEGMPNRVVTKNDYRQLEQQYHIRNGMANLHESRINVLRERQGKQLERIVAKQETELEILETDFERQNEDLDAKFQSEEIQLQQEFANRKARLVARWNLAETIERRILELATGETHGPLPQVSWSDDGDREGGGRRESKEREELLHDANLAYNAMNMI
ncbi:hypothetical protein MMC28_002592 [Mycoblastus sanguinarius]|nr:hypothetical protein [Mycoblastus sanguinarius]